MKKNNKIEKFFQTSKFLSIKHTNYFYIYNQLFEKYRYKKIIFVEIGVANGGSLFIWKKFFKNAKVIGIDLNPDCKKFEKYGFNIEIGDQSSHIFWKNFFRKYGKVDIILDDGGHTNQQQILTAINCIPNIRDGGMLITEDTFCSYLIDFGNPSTYSFINFAKKIVDDINYNYSGLGQFKFSLNKYIHSISFFEGVVAFKINKKLYYKNSIIKNNKTTFGHQDLRYTFNVKNKLKFKILNKLNYLYIILKVIIFNKIQNLKTKKYFN